MDVAITILIFLGGYAAFMIIVIIFVRAFFPFFTKEQLNQKRKLKNVASLGVHLTWLNF